MTGAERIAKLESILRHLAPDKFPDTFFISGEAAEKNDDGLPSHIFVCPAYGCDFAYMYEITGKVMGAEW